MQGWIDLHERLEYPLSARQLRPRTEGHRADPDDGEVRRRAKLYRAAYTGIKIGNPKALVGIGETSARGRDKPLRRAGLQETESPGKFAQLLV